MDIIDAYKRIQMGFRIMMRNSAKRQVTTRVSLILGCAVMNSPKGRICATWSSNMSQVSATAVEALEPLIIGNVGVFNKEQEPHLAQISGASNPHG